MRGPDAGDRDAARPDPLADRCACSVGAARPCWLRRREALIPSCAAARGSRGWLRRPWEHAGRDTPGLHGCPDCGKLVEFNISNGVHSLRAARITARQCIATGSSRAARVRLGRRQQNSTNRQPLRAWVLHVRARGDSRVRSEARGSSVPRSPRTSGRWFRQARSRPLTEEQWCFTRSSYAASNALGRGKTPGKRESRQWRDRRSAFD